ncbi:hypothetical protein IT570_03805 [Candidatus Sumerlaeota bacterium]|nr:hypothetical protein [Candidatus Sumerlaeota bacterium]
MSAAPLTLEVQTTDGRRVFKPGDVVTGTFTVRSQDEWVVENFTIAALWRTEGRGTVDQAIAEKSIVRKRGERVPAKFTHPFSLRLPPHPASTLGTAIHIHWIIVLHARPKGGKEHFHELPIASTFQTERFQRCFNDLPHKDDED